MRRERRGGKQMIVDSNRLLYFMGFAYRARDNAFYYMYY